MTAKTKNSAAQSPKGIVRMRLITAAAAGRTPDAAIAEGPASVSVLACRTSNCLPRIAYAIYYRVRMSVRKQRMPGLIWFALVKDYRSDYASILR